METKSPLDSIWHHPYPFKVTIEAVCAGASWGCEKEPSHFVVRVRVTLLFAQPRGVPTSPPKSVRTLSLMPLSAFGAPKLANRRPAMVSFHRRCGFWSAVLYSSISRSYFVGYCSEMQIITNAAGNSLVTFNLRFVN